MISFSTPKELKSGDVIAATALCLTVLLFVPESFVHGAEEGWTMGSILFPATFVAGLVSSWLYYRHHDAASIDPFYIRAWWGLIGGLVALPACLLLRPSVAGLAFIMIPFGAGPVTAFHAWRRITGRKPGEKRDE